jgi:hypothetical protein
MHYSLVHVVYISHAFVHTYLCRLCLWPINVLPMQMDTKTIRVLPDVCHLGNDPYKETKENVLQQSVN